MQTHCKKILICTNHRANPNNPSCAAKGSQALLPQLALQLNNQGIKMDIEASACLGLCQEGPNMRLMPNGEFFSQVTLETLPVVVEAAKKFLAKLATH